ncbi:MAG TPA: MlaD family protein [Thermoleophilaceae bacterium]|nr:MlaD family protein [Thermoleophilaceae bacterium]
MRSVSGVGRIAAMGAVLAAVVLVALVLFGGGGGEGYTVKARFINAGQLVPGNLVEVGGQKAGSVKDIKITENGQAEITLAIDDFYAPLPEGTQAAIRQASQSGIANRYVDLLFPGSTSDRVRRGEQAGTIDDGGLIGSEETQTAVDLDQLFNTLDPDTRKALQDFFKGSARQYAGRADEANAAFHFLNPALAQTSRLFNELNRDTPTLESFLVQSARLVNTLADRRDELTSLVSNLNSTTRALGNEKEALASAIGQLPDFMRRANTTFVNLRGALNDVDPLVAASKPVAKKLRPFFDELRPFARDARPTIRDLSAIVRRGGSANDLIDLTRTFTPLADIAVDSASRSIDFGTGDKGVGETAGAFPVTVDALRKSTPIIAGGRPYIPELFGWFDDFSNTGVYDAIGGTSRANIVLNPSTVQPPGTPLAQLETLYRSSFRTQQYKRCPGAAEAPAADGSNVFTEEQQRALDCVESARGTSKR